MNQSAFRTCNAFLYFIGIRGTCQQESYQISMHEGITSWECLLLLFSSRGWLGDLFSVVVPPADSVDEDWLLLLACLVTGPTGGIVVYNPIKIINELKHKSTDASDAFTFWTIGYYCMLLCKVKYQRSFVICMSILPMWYMHQLHLATFFRESAWLDHVTPRSLGCNRVEGVWQYGLSRWLKIETRRILCSPHSNRFIVSCLP